MSEIKSHFIHELFVRNERGLFKYLTRRVGREDASDLLQETFVRVLRYNQFEAVADPPSLLQQIAVNLARDFSRRRKTQAKYLEFGDLPEDVASSDSPPNARIEADERWRLLCAAVDALPPRCREVFLLYMRESLSLAEIAKRLGISRNMAQKHMRLALQRCWAALE